MGGARRATGPGSSLLLCDFIEKRWHRGASTSLKLGDINSLLAALVDLGTGCFIPVGMEGLWLAFCTAGQGGLRLLVMGGEGTCGQTLPPALCQLAEGPGARGRERTEGQAIGVTGEGILSCVSHLLGTALSSTPPAIPASSHCALACWVLLCLLPASPGGSTVPLLPAARHAGQCQAASPSIPSSQPAAVAALQGILQGSKYSVHVGPGGVAAHEADAQDLGEKGEGLCLSVPCGVRDTQPGCVSGSLAHI